MAVELESARVSRSITCQLLQLPLELRVQIYRSLLLAPGRLVVTHADKTPSHLSLQSEFTNPDGTSYRSSATLYPSILLTCRQIHREALPILYTGQRGFTFWFQGVVPGSQFAYMDQYVAALLATPILRLADDFTLRVTCTRPTEANMRIAAETVKRLTDAMEANPRKPKLNLDLRLQLLWLLLPARELRKSLQPLKGLEVAGVELDIQIYSKRHLGGEKGFERLKEELKGLFMAMPNKGDVLHPSLPVSRLPSSPNETEAE
ncbi:hypothetical protein H2203_008845 [Taxawa tesnikishii (nom. ined.)]|nr:hypothetical protein H2203_008845 [Dothideales sp. JES 119]